MSVRALNVNWLSRLVAIAILLLAAVSTLGPPSLGYQPAYPAAAGRALSPFAGNQTTTTTVTTTFVSTTTSVQLSRSNQTVTSTVTTSVFSNSDLTTTILAVLAIAALVIAVYAVLKRPRTRSAGTSASVSRVIICPTCGTSNKPSAAFCRKCRTQFR
jgi:ribosomal protein L40E